MECYIIKRNDNKYYYFYNGDNTDEYTKSILNAQLFRDEFTAEGCRQTLEDKNNCKIVKVEIKEMLENDTEK